MTPNLRARVIAEWRGLPERPLEGRVTARPISEALLKLMGSLGLDGRLREDEIRNAWKDVVGEFLAAHSVPTRMQGGTLIVHVLQPTLLYELDRNLKPQILAKLRARFGEKMVRDLKFRIG